MNLDRWFVAANLVGAIAALGINAWDAWRGWPDFRPIRTLTAALAAIYVAAYAILFTGVWFGSDRARWSTVIVGFAPIVWAVVWCGPSITSRIIARRVKAGTARARAVRDPHDIEA